MSSYFNPAVVQAITGRVYGAEDAPGDAPPPQADQSPPPEPIAAPQPFLPGEQANPDLPQVYNMRGGQPVLQTTGPVQALPGAGPPTPLDQQQRLPGVIYPGTPGWDAIQNRAAMIRTEQMAGPLAGLPMSQAERLRMAELHNALGMIDRAEQSGLIRKEDADAGRMQVMTNLNPYLLRRQAEELRQFKIKGDMLAAEADQQGRAARIRGNIEGKLLPDGTLPVLGPNNEVVARFLPKYGTHGQITGYERVDDKGAARLAHDDRVAAVEDRREREKQYTADHHETIKALTVKDDSNKPVPPDLTNPDTRAKYDALMQAAAEARQRFRVTSLPGAERGPGDWIFDAAQSALRANDRHAIEDLRTMDRILNTPAAARTRSDFALYDAAKARVQGHLPRPGAAATGNPATGPVLNQQARAQAIADLNAVARNRQRGGAPDERQDIDTGEPGYQAFDEWTRQRTPIGR